MKSFNISIFSLVLMLNISAQSVGLDATFGDNGIAIADFENVVEQSSFLGQQTDGKLMVGGSYRPPPGFAGTDTFMLVRLHEDGMLDTSYGTGGLANFRRLGRPTGMAVQADNKTIIVGGYRALRLDETGNLDTSFGNNGTVEISFGSHSAICKGVLSLPDGKILMVGWFSENFNNYWPVLVQLLADGSLDTDFGDNGVVYYQEASLTRSYINDAKILPDGKILLAGNREVFSSGPKGWTMWRFLPDGTIDATFGVGGSVSTVMGTQNGFSEEISQIAVQSDGAVVVIGSFTDGPIGSGSVVALARYHQDGTMDVDFGDEGVLIPSFPALAVLRLNSMIIQPDQKILIAGSGSLEGDETAGTSNLQFSRYLPDGTPDPDFDNNGLYTTTTPDFLYSTTAMIDVDEDRVVVAGRTNVVNDNLRPKIFAARLYYGPEIVAVSEPELKKVWLISPNPCQDILRVSSSDAMAPAIVRLRLFSLAGQVAFTASGRHLSEISIGHLPAGSYWLEMTDEQGGVFWEKIVKMN